MKSLADRLARLEMKLSQAEAAQCPFDFGVLTNPELERLDTLAGVACERHLTADEESEALGLFRKAGRKPACSCRSRATT